MFKIGEFSKITQVSVRMLRYYDEHKLVVPSFVDSSNGYRFYTAEQIQALNRVVLLRNMGFGVKEIKKLLLSWNPEILRQNLTEKLEKTEEVIQGEQNQIKQIQGFLKDLDNQNKNLDIQILIKSIPQQQVISLRKIVPNYYSESVLWEEISNKLSDVNRLESGQSFSIYHDLDYREQDVDIEVCVGMNHEYTDIHTDLIFRQVDRVDMAACFMIFGPYSNISIAYKEFAFWLEQHNEYCMAGENRQICHVSMCHTMNAEEYITELQIPLAYQRAE
ncbi:MAG: MerR family transcriptional regulator [Velocimicrobium sp.]